MVTDSYGFEVKEIDKLNQLEYGSKHYIYKDTHFLLKNTYGINTLLIAFHGSIALQYPVFRCYNYEGTNVLSISDKLVNIYGNDSNDKFITLSWYLNSLLHPDNIKIYREIIANIISIYGYSKILFYGSSAGGYPALYYSAIFNRDCLITNCQIYLKAYYYYYELEDILEKYSDRLEESASIEEHFHQHGFPSSIYLFSNTEDTHHYNYHTLPFIDFCSKHQYSKLKANIFTQTDENVIPHSIFFPNNTDGKEIILKILNDNQSE